ncbi:MAG: DUF1579 family protein [Planctomycetes bacterium]|nr:DUF1579 family protein [Planctomycetota bacterium]
MNLFVGSWETVVVDVSESGVESDARPGRATIEWIFGGRYLRWDAVLELGGETHATTGYLGYDVNQAEYQLLMISDLATGMGVAHGRGEPNSKGITLTLEIVDPRSGALQRARSVLRVLGADHFVLEQMAGDGSGGERVARRTHYRRS